MRCARAPARADSTSNSSVIGMQRGARRGRRVAQARLKREGQEEEGAAECAVQDERDQVGPGELAGPEDVERQHRMAAPSLDLHECRDRDRTANPTTAFSVDERVA